MIHYSIKIIQSNSMICIQNQSLIKQIDIFFLFSSSESRVVVYSQVHPLIKVSIVEFLYLQCFVSVFKIFGYLWWYFLVAIKEKWLLKKKSWIYNRCFYTMMVIPIFLLKTLRYMFIIWRKLNCTVWSK